MRPYIADRRKVLILGVNFRNRGAELMLLAAIDKISSDLDAQPVVEVQHGDPNLRRFYGIQPLLSVQKLRFHPSLPRLAQAHALCRKLPIALPNQIDAVLDASGFAFGDAWSHAPLERRANHLDWWAQRGVPVYLLPQAFGPFENTSRAGRTAIDAAQIAYARDPESHAHALGIASTSSRIGIAPDFTTLLHSDDSRHVGAIDVPFSVIVPNRQIANRLSRQDSDRYVARLVAYAIALADRGQVLLLNHEGEGDLALIKEIHSAVPATAVADGWSGLESKAVLGRAQLLVGGRYHALVSALSQGVPSIIHGWSHKYLSLARDFGIQSLVEDPSHQRPPVEVVDEVLADTEGLSETIQSNAAMRRSETEAMWREIAQDLAW